MMMLKAAALLWLTALVSAEETSHQTGSLRHLQDSTPTTAPGYTLPPYYESEDSDEDGDTEDSEDEDGSGTPNDQDSRSICDYVCDQGACAGGETEICHNGKTICIDESGWNGHCRHSPRGQEDLCGSCDGSSGGPAQKRGGGRGGGVQCFAGETRVTVQGEGLTAMKDLSVGQSILTESGYEKVYAFGHYQPERVEEMLEITATAMGTPLQITQEHLLKVQDGSFVAAGEIKVGDKLTDSATVTKIQSVQGQGLYAPLVQSGSFVVQGSEVVASSYVAVAKTTSVSHQDWVHFYLTPYRLFCHGVAPNLCQPEYNSEASGIPHYIDMGLSLLETVFGSDSWVLQGLFLSVTVPLIMVLAAVEQLLNLSMLAKVMMAATVLAVRKMTTRDRKSVV